jgi:hypothetical protein
MISYSIEYFDLPFHFAFLDWLEHFDDDLLISDCIHASVDFRVFALADLVDNLVVLDVSA